MEKPKGLFVNVEFGEIRVNLDVPELDVDKVGSKDQINMITKTIEQAAKSVIEIQKSLR